MQETSRPGQSNQFMLEYRASWHSAGGFHVVTRGHPGRAAGVGTALEKLVDCTKG